MPHINSATAASAPLGRPGGCGDREVQGAPILAAGSQADREPEVPSLTASEARSPRPHVLIITYYFDQDREIGGVRPRAAAQFLAESGWRTTVVTAGDPADDRTAGGLSVHHVRPARQSSGHRTGIRGELAGLVPEKLGWSIRAARLAVALGRRGPANVVLSSAPSQVVNLTAWYAARRLHVPWVAEFRDLWAKNPFRTGSRLRRVPDEILERVTLRRASAAVTVSEPLAAQLRRDHPRLAVRAISTGVDPSLIAPQHVELDPHFCLLYAGRLYLGHRDLVQVLRPLRTAIDRGLIDASQTRLHVLLLDRMPPETVNEIARLGLQAVVDVESNAARLEVIDRERRAQVLLHLRWDDPAEQGIVTGKIYEYLAARRPILSTGRYRDVVVELLERTGAGVGTTTDDAVVDWLGRSFAEYQASGRVSYAARPDELAAMSLRGTASQIEQVLMDAIGATGSGVTMSRR